MTSFTNDTHTGIVYSDGFSTANSTVTNAVVANVVTTHTLIATGLPTSNTGVVGAFYSDANGLVHIVL